MRFMKLFGRLEEPKISHQSICFTRIGDFTWRASDCEVLVVATAGDVVNDL